MACLAERPFDIVLADLSLPDSQGLATFERVQAAAPDEPIVVLTGLDDEEVALKAMRTGAQDYLVKGRMNGELLVRSLRYAMERKQAERRLRISEARFKAFMDNSPAIAWMKDAAGHTTTSTPPGSAISGARWIKSEAPWIWSLWPAPIAQRLRESDERMLLARTPLQLVEMMPDSDGVLRTWLTYKFPLQNAGGATLVGGMAMDLTEQERAKEALRDSEERYRRLVEVSPDAIFIAKQNEIAFINEAGLRLFGAERGEQILGKSLFDLIRFDDQDSVRERLDDLMNHRRSFDFFEERIARIDGGARVDAEVAVAPLIDRGAPAIQVVLHDITERKRTEHEIRARVEQQAVVAELGLYALKTHDLGALMDRAATVIAETLQVELCEVLELLPEERSCCCAPAVGWKTWARRPRDGADGTAIRMRATPGCRRARDRGGPAPGEAFRPDRAATEHGVVSGMSVVIATPNRPYGVLGAHAREWRRFTPTTCISCRRSPTCWRTPSSANAARSSWSRPSYACAR